MKHTWIFALAILIMAAGYGESRSGGKDYADVQRNLERLEQICIEHLPRSKRRESIRLIREIKEELDAGFVFAKPPISDEAFAEVLGGVQSRGLSSDKKDLIVNTCASASMSCAQLRLLTAEIKFDRHRVETVKAVYSSIYDPENIALVIAVVQSRSSKQELEQWVAGQSQKR